MNVREVADLAVMVLRIIILTVIFVSCRSGTDDPPWVPLNDGRDMKVEVVTATVKPIRRKLLGEGVVKYRASTEIYARVSGYAVRVLVRNWAAVRKGDTLAVLEDIHKRFNAERAVIEFERSRYLYESMRMGYGDDGLAGLDTVDNALRLESGLTMARLSLRQSEWEISQLVITSPADGMLTDWDVPEGRLVRPDQLLGRIRQFGQAWLAADFLETEAAILKPGIRASARLVSGKQLEIRCAEVGPEISEKGLIRTWWEVPGNEIVREGQHASIEAEVITGSGIYLPRSAIVDRNGQPVVFIVKRDTVRWKEVETGWYAENEVEVRSGVLPGDLVATAGQFALHEGIHVQAVKKK